MKKLAFALFLGLGLMLLARLWLLPAMGHWLVEDGAPVAADQIVVLATGAEYYPRAIEAARLWQAGHAPRLLVNGNRKTATRKALEARGYRSPRPWTEGLLHLYEFLGVPAAKVTPVSLPDAFDTVSEAQGLVARMGDAPPRSVLLVTSRFHTRRAATIWRRALGAGATVVPIAARSDPFDPDHWWRHARQIKWVMTEYGGWLSLIWRQ